MKMYGAVYIGGMVYVYGIVQSSTNELLYVGQTRNLEQRTAAHRSTTVKDIKDDFHLVILEYGYDLPLSHEMFWIEYMTWLGCSLRNKAKTFSVRDFHYERPSRGVDFGFCLPHLVHDMAEKGITVGQMHEITGLSFSDICQARAGEKMPPHAAKKISRVLQLGASIFEGLSARRKKNLLEGVTTVQDVLKENARRKKIAHQYFTCPFGYKCGNNMLKEDQT